MRLPTVRRATMLALLLAVGCGGGSAPAPTTTTTAAPTPTTLPATTLPSTTTPPTTLPAATDPEEARKILREHGIDPDKLSQQIGEQMRQRFQQQNGN